MNRERIAQIPSPGALSPTLSRGPLPNPLPQAGEGANEKTNFQLRREREQIGEAISNSGGKPSTPVPSPACGITSDLLASFASLVEWLVVSPRGLGRGPKNKQTLTNAKSLRTNQTEAEQRLWYHLRAHRFMNLKFKRQKPLGSYIVDFVCMERFLIIELDGGQHAEQANYDRQRDAWLRSQGYTVLRFWNMEVMQQLEEVLEKIRAALILSADYYPLPHPSPDALSPTLSRKREREQKRRAISNSGGRGE